MKRLSLLVAGMILSIGILQAQVEIKGLVGTNFSTLANPPEGAEVAANAGFQFGAGVLIGEKFYIEPGIQFVRNTKTFTADTEEFTFSQNFVKIPVYAGYHLLGHESGRLALRAFAGPAVSIAGKIAKGDDQITKEDIENALIMADVGIGVDIFFLFAEVNYEYAFNKYWTDEALDSKHTGFLVNVGIHLDF